MAKLIGREPFHGYRFDGERFDCGDKAGFLDANLAFALARSRARRPAARDILEKHARGPDAPGHRPQQGELTASPCASP